MAEQSPQLRAMIEDVLASERRKRGEFALGTAMGGSLALAGADPTAIATTNRRMFPTQPRQPGQQAELLDHKQKLLRDLSEFVQAMSDDTLGFSEKVASSVRAQKGLIDIIEQVVQTQGSTQADVAAAKIRAEVDLRESFLKGLRNHLHGRSPGSSAALSVYKNIRDELNTIESDGESWTQRMLLGLRNMLRDQMLDPADKASIFAALAAETFATTGKDLLEVIRDAETARDPVARDILSMYHELAPLIQSQGEAILRETSAVTRTGLERIAEMGGSDAVSIVKRVISEVGPLLEGSTSVPEAQMERARAALGTIDAMQQPVMDEYDQAIRAVDAMLNEKAFDTSGGIGQVRRALKQEGAYRSWAEQNGLDPDLDSTLKAALQVFRRNTRGREQENRTKIRELFRRNSGREGVKKSAAMAGGGAGREAELGSASVYPGLTEDQARSYPVEKAFRLKDQPTRPETPPPSPPASPGPGRLFEDSEPAPVAKPPPPADLGDPEAGTELMAELGFAGGVEPMGLMDLNRPYTAMMKAGDKDQVVIWDPELRRFIDRGPEVEQVEAALAQVLQEKGRDAMYELVKKFRDRFQQIRQGASKHRESLKFLGSSPGMDAVEPLKRRMESEGPALDAMAQPPVSQATEQRRRNNLLRRRQRREESEAP